MKITDFENEEALDLLADIIEPISVICIDKEVKKVAKAGNRLKLVQYIIKNYKTEIITILARMNNTPVKDYKCNLLSITKDLLELFNDPEVTAVFTS